MLDELLFIAYYSSVLLFGVFLSVSFSGIRLFEKKNLINSVILFTVCGLLQLLIFSLSGESLVWKLYPLVTHVPVILFLYIFYHQRIMTALSSVTTAYLCCQPAKWFGLLCSSLNLNYAIEITVRIIVLLIMGIISLQYMAPYVAKLYNKDFRSIYILGTIPVFYYFFDYITGIYTNLWYIHSRLTAEFVHFFLCLFFISFCVIYSNENEQKMEAERRENLIRISAQQQNLQIEAVKRTETEIKILRHDMRLFLNSLAVCIENNELDNAQEMISSYCGRIDGTKLEHFCENDIINYVLSDFSEKCRFKNIPFHHVVELEVLHVDEMLFGSILSNALDNALNAQEKLPDGCRNVKVMLKNMDGKLLLSVKNAVASPPLFVDGLPITDQKGHGYGTKSIRYITERLGGNCQFSVQDGWFVVRIIL